MAGVEILAVEEVAVGFGFNWLYFWIAVGIFIGVGLITGLITSYLECDFIMLGICISIFIPIGMFFGLIYGFADAPQTAYETQYKVAISDEVKMNEFLEKYEIIDQEGKIYTVRERD